MKPQKDAHSHLFKKDTERRSQARDEEESDQDTKKCLHSWTFFYPWKKSGNIKSLYIYCLVWGDDCHAITITVSTHPVISRVYSWHRFFHLVCHVFIIKHPHTGGHISYFLYAIIKYQAKASQGRKDYISGF